MQADILRVPVGPGAMHVERYGHGGAAVILSSHLLHLVEELCTKLLVIHHGRTIAYGAFDEIVAERPQLAGRGLEEVFLALTSDLDPTSRQP